jgi:hypothetical protein
MTGGSPAHRDDGDRRRSGLSENAAVFQLCLFDFLRDLLDPLEQAAVQVSSFKAVDEAAADRVRPSLVEGIRVDPGDEDVDLALALRVRMNIPSLPPERSAWRTATFRSGTP